MDSFDQWRALAARRVERLSPALLELQEQRQTLLGLAPEAHALGRYDHAIELLQQLLDSATAAANS